MKTIPAGLLAHYQGGTTSLCQCIKFTRADGVVLGYTSAQDDLLISGVTYLAGPGLEVTEIVSSSGLAVDNLELTILADDTGTITRQDLLTGRWNGAAFEIFECNYADLAAGVHILKRGTTGEVGVNRGAFQVELRSLAQALQQTIGAVTSKTCRYRLGDANCGVDLAPFTHAGTVTAVASQQQFTASALAQPADYFVEGTVRFTSGLNTGYTQKCKIFTSGKVFTLSLPMPYAITVADTFTAIAGCQKRHLTDCKTKFSNILNFGGEPDLPGMDALLTQPAPDAS